jgi:hypothetical protein
MPYVNKPRPYKKEAKYEDSPQQVKNREERNAARRKLMREGKVHKGDGKDVDHMKPVSKGGKNNAGNLDVRTAHNNRSFSRNPDHTVKVNRPKKKK